MKRIVRELPQKKVVEPKESSGVDLSTAESVTDDSDQDLEMKTSRPKLEGDDELTKTKSTEDSSRRNPFSTKGNFSVSQEHSLPERYALQIFSLIYAPLLQVILSKLEGFVKKTAR